MSEAKLKANKATFASELSSVDEEMSKKRKHNNSLFGKHKNIYKSPPTFKKSSLNSGNFDNSVLMYVIMCLCIINNYL